MSAAALGPSEPGSPDLWRWSLSFAAVLAFHALALAGLASLSTSRIEPGEALPAVMIDMAPPPTGPVAAPYIQPLSEDAPEMAVPEPVLNLPPDLPEPDMGRPDEADVIQPPSIPPSPEPPPPPRESAAIAFPPPPAKVAPPRPKPVEKKADAEPARKADEGKQPPKPVSAKRGQRQEGRREPVGTAGGQATASLPSASTGAAAASRASWQGALLAHLRRNLRPQGDQSGVASVRFSVDRGGRVLSASLAGSAGSPALDSEAVAVFRRAQPLPAPPPDVPGASFTFTVPIRFTAR